MSKYSLTFKAALPHLLTSSAWIWLVSPLLWMWPNIHSAIQVLQSTILLMGALLFRITTRIATVVLWVLGIAFLSYFYALHTLPDEFFWQSLLNSNPDEAWEYVTSYRPADAVLLLLWAIPGLLAIWHLWRQPRVLKHPKLRAVAWLTIVAWVVWFGVTFYKKQDMYDTLRRFKRVYPWMMVQSWESYQLNTAITLEPAPQAPPPHKPMVDLLLVVIGESASAHRWSLLGYTGNPTNAALAPFSHQMISLPLTTNGNNTAKALPVIVTGQSMTPLPTTGIASYLDYAKAAGFYSEVFSNQNAPGFAYVALRTRSDKFVRIQDRSFDGELTPHLEQALEQYRTTHNPTLITLHTYGSHPQVDKRYPQQSAPWQDPYDNSIHYSNELLSNWISKLEAFEHQRVALLYISDHGQDFPVCGGSYVHGITRSAYEVPFLLWANTTLRQAQPLWWQQWQGIAQHAINEQGIPRFNTLLVAQAIQQLLGYSSPLPEIADWPVSHSYPPPETADNCTNWAEQVKALHPAANIESN